MPPYSDVDALLAAITDAAADAQAQLGNRAGEFDYKLAMRQELGRREIDFVEDAAFSVRYRGVELPGAFTFDFVVAGTIGVLVRERGRALEHHRSHLESYLRHSKLPVGVAFDLGEWPVETYGTVVIRQAVVDPATGPGVSR